MTVVGLFLTWNSSWVCRKKTDFDQCGGAGPLFTGSGSRYFFYTGSGSFSYKNRLKSSKKSVFAFKSSHRLRLWPKSTSSSSATLILIDHKLILIGEPFFVALCFCFLCLGSGSAWRYAFCIRIQEVKKPRKYTVSLGEYRAWNLKRSFCNT